MEKRALQFRGLISVCDELIRGGKIAEAEKRLSELSPAKVPRELLMEFAKLCRRSGLNSLGARLLHPVIRADRRKHAPPTAGEICEYAVLIARLGYTSQALQMLATVDPAHVPEALLFRGYCHVSLWDYDSAARAFTAYLRFPLEPYQRLIAQVNLAAAEIENGRTTEAGVILGDAMAAARATNASRLLANGHEMSGRIAMANGDWIRAEGEFEKARELLGRSQSLDQLLIEKNLAWIEAQRSSNPERLLHFRKLAEQRRHWDSVREADRLLLHLRFDQELFEHLIFGTPLKAYRERISREFSTRPPAYYMRNGSQARFFDLATGEVPGFAEAKPGQKIHRLLAILGREFYAPISIGGIFSGLYPDEYFDVDHSAVRVAQVIHRSRLWLNENKIAMSIEHENGFYRLSLGRGFAMRVPFDDHPPSAEEVAMARLTNSLRERSYFRIQDVCETLEISRTQAHRLLRSMLNEKHLESFGTGRSTTYSFPQSQSNVA